jgi:hypothetical protein
MGVQDSRVYLSRQVNNILQIFGSNVKISGLDITINNNNKLINNKIASFTISPGKCIVDTTLHIFPTATTLELDVSPYDPSGYLVIVVSYKYIESLQQNRPIFKLLYVTSDGLDQLPDAWSPNRDNLILGVFKFNNQSLYDIIAYDGNIISINNNTYTINPLSDTIGYQHYLGGSDSEPDCNRYLLSDGDLYFDLVQNELFIYNGWSPIEDTFESNTNYSSSVTLYTLTVTKSGTGTGTVISSPSGINCGSTCSYHFMSDTSVTLTAAPDASSSFNSWSGDATGTNTTSTVTMDSDKTVHAEFDLVYYNLTVTKSGTGTGTVISGPAGINCGNTCTYQFVANTNITLTATPDSSSAFSGWSDDANGTNTTTTVIMSGDKNVTATFAPLYTLTITKSGAGTGIVTSNPSGVNCGATCSYRFAFDTSVTLTATANSGSVFGGWSGDVTGSDTAITFTMSANKNVTATFNTAYTLTVIKSGTGTGTVTSSPSGINCGSTCSYQFATNTSVTLTAVADSSSLFGGWTGDVTGTDATVTVTMSSNKSVTATFNTAYTLTITKSGTGTGTVTSSPSGINCGATCSYQFAPNTSVTLTATSDTGSIFGGWSGDATGSNTTVTVTMSANKSVTATFNINTGNGYFAGGYNGSSNQNFIDKLLFSDESQYTLAAKLSQSVWNQSACNSSSTGYFAGGYTNSLQSFIDKLLFSNDSRSTLTTTLSQTVDQQSACNSTLAGYFAGGNSGGGFQKFIDKLLFSDESRSTLTAALSLSVYGSSACNSTLSGYFAGGSTGGVQNFIDKLLFSNDSRSTLSATLSQAVDYQSACNSLLSGYFAGGFNSSYYQNFIDKLLFNNDSRSTLAATLSRSALSQSACNSTLSGYFAGGYYDDGSTSHYYEFIDKLLFSDDSRSTLVATLSRPIYDQSACQSGGIV